MQLPCALLLQREVAEAADNALLKIDDALVEELLKRDGRHEETVITVGAACGVEEEGGRCVVCVACVHCGSLPLSLWVLC